MNPSTNTYAQNLRLRKIQNRQFSGQDKFNIGKRGEPIPGKMDSVTIARKQRRALKRPGNLKKVIQRLESTIMWHNKKITELEKALEKSNDKKLLREAQQHQLEISYAQQTLLQKQQSLAALLS